MTRVFSDLLKLYKEKGVGCGGGISRNWVIFLSYLKDRDKGIWFFTKNIKILQPLKGYKELGGRQGTKTHFFRSYLVRLYVSFLLKKLQVAKGRGGNKRHTCTCTLSFCSRLKDLGEVVRSFLKKLTFKRAK